MKVKDRLVRERFETEQLERLEMHETGD